MCVCVYVVEQPKGMKSVYDLSLEEGGKAPELQKIATQYESSSAAAAMSPSTTSSGGSTVGGKVPPIDLNLKISTNKAGPLQVRVSFRSSLSLSRDNCNIVFAFVCSKLHPQRKLVGWFFNSYENRYVRLNDRTMSLYVSADEDSAAVLESMPLARAVVRLVSNRVCFDT